MYFRSIHSVTTWVILGLIVLPNFAQAAIRVLPRSDYAKGSLITRGLDLISGRDQLVFPGTPRLGGNVDLVIQPSINQRDVEVFACSTIKDCVASATGDDKSFDATKVASCNQDQKYWNCVQLYTLPKEQVCDEFVTRFRDRVMGMWLISNALGTAIETPIPFFSLLAVTIPNQIAGAFDIYNAAHDIYTASCSNLQFSSNFSTAMSSDLAFVREVEKQDVTRLHALFRIRGREGMRHDMRCEAIEGGEEQQMRLGGFSRQVVMNPAGVSAGSIPYTVVPNTLMRNNALPAPAGEYGGVDDLPTRNRNRMWPNGIPRDGCVD